MSLQESIGVKLAYGIQTDIDTIAAAGGTAQYLRRVSTSLTGQKDTFQSQEVRPNFQIQDYRHGTRRVGGGFQGELSTQTYDDLLAAIMRSSWVSGVALSQSDFTSLTVSSGVVTLGSGNPSTLGLRVGQIIDFAGMSVSGNNTRCRITAMSSTTITVVKTADPTTTLADQTADTSCSITAVGKNIINGVAQHAFTFEQYHSTIDLVQVFKHCRLNSAAIQLPPSGIATIGFDVMGRDFETLTGGSAPYFTGPPTDAPTTDLLDGLGGVVRIAGSEVAVVTGADIAISHNMSSQPVIGSNLVPEIFYGLTTVSGNISYFLQDEDLLDAFDNEDEIGLFLEAVGADGSFMAFNMARVKLGSPNMQVGNNGGVQVSQQFMALYNAASTGYDATTLSIQRSNS